MDFRYPYTDMHELNLDWFLAEFKKYYEKTIQQDEKIQSLDETVTEFTNFVTNYFDNLDVQQEINNKLNQMASDGTLLNLIKPYYDEIASAQNGRIAVLESRMDTFASLPDGSLAGNAELADIRVAVNGYTYDTAGNAIRGQIGYLDEITMTTGEPSGIIWELGSLTSTGAATNAYKNSARSSVFKVKKNTRFIMNTGYYIRVYMYATDGSGFVSRSNWVTSYVVSNDYIICLLVSDAAHYNDSSSVLPDTSCSEQLVWTYVILNTLNDEVKPLIDEKDDLAFGGYLSLNRYLKPDLSVETGAVGTTLSMDYIQNNTYTTLVYKVAKGDVFKITGAAQGSSSVRLWCFTDIAYKVLSVAQIFATGTDVVLKAPAAGYIIFNANLQDVLYPPAISKYVRSIDDSSKIDTDNMIYDDFNKYNDILSAFSNIMCCGDSLTASVVYTGISGGQNVTRAAYRRYPQILADKTGAAVEYHALGGYSATDWWDAYNQYIVSKTNQLAIIYIGTNGGLTDTLDTDAPGSDVADYDKTTNTGAYCAIVKSFLDARSKVLLLHINKMSSGLLTTNEVIDKIAEKFKVAVVTVPLMTDLKYHSWPDGQGSNSLHYNDLGYAAFTESLIKHVAALNDTMMSRLIPD